MSSCSHLSSSICSVPRSDYPSPPFSLGFPSSFLSTNIDELCYGEPLNVKPDFPVHPQLSLILAEISFLSHFSPPFARVFIVHQANFQLSRIHLIAQLFPNLDFSVFDVNGLSHLPVHADSPANVTLHSEPLNLSSPLLLHSSCALLISHCVHLSDSSPSYLRDVSSFISCFSPSRYLIRFRVPFHPGSTSFPSGHCQYSLWSGVNAAEVRLIGDSTSKSISSYCNTKFEQKLFFFNSIHRFTLYKQTNLHELCWDCTAERVILADYLSDPQVFSRVCLSTSSEENSLIPSLDDLIDFLSSHIRDNLPLPPKVASTPKRADANSKSSFHSKRKRKYQANNQNFLKKMKKQ
jgi:hypothetical protein